jgi:hypothetical protein
MIRRRGFLMGIAAAVPLGAAAAITRKRQVRPDPRDNPEAFRLDLDQFGHVDPALLDYMEVPQVADGLKGASTMSLAPDGTLYLGVGKKILRLAEGSMITAVEAQERVTAVAVSGDSTVWTAVGPVLGRYDAKGRQAGEPVHLGERAYVTSIALDGEKVFVADAGQRTVWIFSMEGRLQGRIDGRLEGPGDPGFVVPSPWFHAAAEAGELWVTNPGRQRVECYVDGIRTKVWGLAGMSADQFCGCCNPTHLALLPGGGFVTSEKGIPRVKVYDSEGKLGSVVAGANAFDEGTTGLAVAAESDGRILVLDPARGQVRAFTRRIGENRV